MVGCVAVAGLCWGGLGVICRWDGHITGTSLHSCSPAAGAVAEHALLCHHLPPFPAFPPFASTPISLPPQPDDGSSEIYTGSLKAPELRTFLDGFASKEPVAPDAASSSTGTDSKQGGVGAGGGPQDIFSGVQVVVHSLDSSNLTEIDQQDDMWLLAFHASSGRWGLCRLKGTGTAEEVICVHLWDCWCVGVRNG